MTPLQTSLIAHIRQHGPMSIETYMNTCLYDDAHGFYMSQLPLGKHFITAPEVSQLFGEMVAIWILLAWQHLGNPCTLNIVELGPGRGTMAKDILRTWHRIANQTSEKPFPMLHYSLQEISPTLQAQQQATLASLVQKNTFKLHWISDTQEWPKGPTLFLANEFFDALPIRQFEKMENTWKERCIGLDGERLSFQLQDTTHPPQGFPENGSFYEYAPALPHWGKHIAQHLGHYGGAALLIDYGYDGNTSYLDTLQAIHNHCPVPVLEQPGLCDLTAHVNFGALTEVFSQALPCAKISYAVSPLMSQQAFLMKHGFMERLQQLLTGCSSGEEKEQVAQGGHRLISSDGMGDLFRVLTVQSVSKGG